MGCGVCANFQNWDTSQSGTRDGYSATFWGVVNKHILHLFQPFPNSKGRKFSLNGQKTLVLVGHKVGSIRHTVSQSLSKVEPTHV